MQKPTTLFFPCRSLCCFFTPNSFFSHIQQRFSHSQTRGAEPTKPSSQLSFHCAFFLCKSLESLAKISPHNLGRAFYSPGGLSTAPTLSVLSCAAIQGTEGGKAKVCPALVLEFCVWRLCPSQRVWKH